MVRRKSGDIVGGVDRVRALHRWKTKAGEYTVTFNGHRVRSTAVDWTGFTVPPARPGGPGGQARQRRTEPISTRVEEGCTALLDEIVAEGRFPHRGAYFTHAIKRDHRKMRSKKST